MKLLSHTDQEKSVKVSVSDTEDLPSRRKKRETKEEKEKKGRYIGFVLLLLTIIGGFLLNFFR